MKALVTGATGFIGSHVVDLLLKNNIEVKCNIRHTSNLRWLKDKPLETVIASLNDKNSLIEAVKDVDYIYHIAGVTFAKKKEEFFKGNYEATKNLLEVIEKYNPNIKRFLFVSSQTVSGPAKSLDEPKTEDMTCNPITTYGKSKKAAEDEVLKYKDKFPITIIRAPAVYGPRDTAIYSVFKTVKIGIGAVVGLRPKYLSLIHSEDLVRGIYQASIHNRTIGEIYFVSSEKFYTWDEIIPKISKFLNKKFVLKIRLPHFIVLTTAAISEVINQFTSKPSVFNYEKGIDFIQDYWICSTQKAVEHFNYRQKVDIDNGLQQTIQWYKSNGWL